MSEQGIPHPADIFVQVGNKAARRKKIRIVAVVIDRIG
jgi:hypothetical protein